MLVFIINDSFYSKLNFLFQTTSFIQIVSNTVFYYKHAKHALLFQTCRTPIFIPTLQIKAQQLGHGCSPTKLFSPTTFSGHLTVIIGIMKLIVFIIIAFFVILISIVVVIIIVIVIAVTSIIEIPSSIGSPAPGLKPRHIIL